MNYDFQSLFKLHPKKILEEASKIKSKSLTKKEEEALNKAKEFIDKVKELDNDTSRKKVAILALAYFININSDNK